MSYWKKIFILAVGVALVSSSFPGLITPEKALALVVYDPVNHATNIKTSIESTVSAVTESASFSQQLLEWAQSFVLSTLKRRILDVMVDQVVTWVQGGGEPRFITDWESFLGDIGQGAVGEFVEKIGAGFLCEPFSLQIQMNLLPVQRFGNNAPFSCTLDEIVQNVEDFYEDFRNGGWIAYNAQWQPQNNYYGALLIAWDARNNYVADKLAAAANNALANKGFLGTKRCYDVDTGEEVSEGAPFSRCEDTTPGGIVSSALEKAVGTDFDFIINAQQLGDYAAAIVNALVNRLIMEGVNGIRGVHSGGGGAYQPSRNAGTTYGGFQSTGNVPGGVSGAISSYGRTAGRGALTGVDSRTELINRLNAAIAIRTNANNDFDAAFAIVNPFLRLREDIIACIQTSPSPSFQRDLNPGQQFNLTIYDRYDAVQNPREENQYTLQELSQAALELATLTDEQYARRATEFIAANVAADASTARLTRTQAQRELIETQAQITAARIAESQQYLNACIASGGRVPPRGTP